MNMVTSRKVLSAKIQANSRGSRALLALFSVSGEQVNSKVADAVWRGLKATWVSDFRYLLPS